jgi:hypothetical protein
VVRFYGLPSYRFGRESDGAAPGGGGDGVKAARLHLLTRRWAAQQPEMRDASKRRKLAGEDDRPGEPNGPVVGPARGSRPRW